MILTIEIEPCVEVIRYVSSCLFVLVVFMQFLRGCGGAEAARTERSVAERVVWEQRAPATAHGAHHCVFYTFAHTYLSNAVFYSYVCRYENNRRYFRKNKTNNDVIQETTICD